MALSLSSLECALYKVFFPSCRGASFLWAHSVACTCYIYAAQREEGNQCTITHHTPFWNNHVHMCMEVVRGSFALIMLQPWDETKGGLEGSDLFPFLFSSLLGWKSRNRRGLGWHQRIWKRRKETVNWVWPLSEITRLIMDIALVTKVRVLNV